MTRRVCRWTQSCPRTGGVLYAGAHDSTGPAADRDGEGWRADGRREGRDDRQRRPSPRTESKLTAADEPPPLLHSGMADQYRQKNSPAVSGPEIQKPARKPLRRSTTRSPPHPVDFTILRSPKRVRLRSKGFLVRRGPGLGDLGTRPGLRQREVDHFGAGASHVCCWVASLRVDAVRGAYQLPPSPHGAPGRRRGAARPHGGRRPPIRSSRPGLLLLARDGRPDPAHPRSAHKANSATSG